MSIAAHHAFRVEQESEGRPNLKMAHVFIRCNVLRCRAQAFLTLLDVGHASTSEVLVRQRSLQTPAYQGYWTPELTILCGVPCRSSGCTLDPEL